VIPLVAATAVAAFVAAGAPKATDCTWTGTNVRDVKAGTAGRNVLCSLPGNDFVHGKAGDDVIRAGDGRDTAVGGGGRDVIRGGKGPDKLFAVDGQGGELIVGGSGLDQCFGDVGDRMFGCERLFRSTEPDLGIALSQSLGSVMEIVEEVTPTPPPIVVTVTETQTVPPNCGGHPAPPPIC